MANKLMPWLLLAVLSIALPALLFAEENITIGSYYPSPYGSYNELGAYKMKIGANYSGSGVTAVANSLIVEGGIGIGTSTLTSGLKLDVEGDVGAQRYCDNNGANCKTITEMGGALISGTATSFNLPATSSSYRVLVWVSFSASQVYVSNTLYLDGAYIGSTSFALVDGGEHADIMGIAYNVLPGNHALTCSSFAIDQAVWIAVPAQDSFSWYVDGWSGVCNFASGTCGPGTEYQAYWCVDGNGNAVPGSYCSGSPTLNSRACCVPCDSSICGYQCCNLPDGCGGTIDCSSVCGPGEYCVGGYACTCVPTGGGGDCFIVGTKITMADGSLKNIEDVAIGEKVKGRDGINTVVDYVRPKVGTRRSYVINGKVEFMGDHPFLSPEGWKVTSIDEYYASLDSLGIRESADLKPTELKIGDTLLTEQGDEEVKSIQRRDRQPDETVYDFRLDGDHTYIADGFIARTCRDSAMD